MKVKDPKFVLERVEKYVQEDIRPSRIRDRIELDCWKYIEAPLDEVASDCWKPDYDDSSWEEYHLGEYWGSYDQVAWFRRKVTIPEGFVKHQAALRMLVGPRDGGGSTAETLLWIDGQPIQAIDIWHEEALLEPEIASRHELQLSLKAWYGVLNVPQKRRFKVAELLDIDMKVDKFCFLMDNLRLCVLELDENDLRRIRLTRLLNETLNKINYLNYRSEEYYRSVYDALEYLQAGMKHYAAMPEIKPTVNAVGHSHIDMGWLWRVTATHEKASRTFATVLNLMKQYPEYIYMHSSPQLLKFLKQDYPVIYEGLRERAKEGRFEITGGMWVESDTNIPSGESLIRQFVYGKRFVREEFGREMTVVWLPDVFGYSGNFPQICTKSGMKYFMTTKISWNQYNVFPHDTFWWKGIDGSELFTHFITTPENGSWYYTYVGHMEPQEITGIWRNYKDKDKNDSLLISYGWGDGGGGPTREMLEAAEAMKNIPGIPYVRTTRAEDYFAEMYQNADKKNMAHWDGELYFEMHRGTYTSQADNKKNNRKTEILMHNVEFISTLAAMKDQKFHYPKEKLDDFWERMLLDQFHDILPGSSIRQVYEDTARDYAWIQEEGGKCLELAARSILFAATGEQIALWNTTGVERSDYVLLPYENNITPNSVLIRGNRALVCEAQKNGLLVYAENLPAYSYTIFDVKQKHKEQPTESIEADFVVSDDERHIKTQHYVLELGENGQITYLYDRDNDREISDGTAMNVLRAFEDKPQRFDAWDIDIFYKEKPYNEFCLSRRKVTVTRERVEIEQAFTFNKSALTQTIVLTNRDRRIDFVTHIDWKERQVLLKTYFPVKVHAKEASYEIQYGVLRRPTHENTEYDFAQFEVCGHRFADLSERDYGVALLNDSKYGYDTRDNVLGLTLLRSPVNPDESADRHEHNFTYSLLPHAEDLDHSDVQEQAIRLNMPVLASSAGAMADSFTLLSCDTNDVIVDTVKRSEDGTALIVRLYESADTRHDAVRLAFHVPITIVEETDLCEENGKRIEVRDNSITFAISHYEIKTFKVILK